MPSHRTASIVCGLLTVLSASLADGWTLEDGDHRKARIAELVVAPDANLPDELRESKHRLMADRLHDFVRGTAALFHRDLTDRRRLGSSIFHGPDTRVWIQGDAHVRNVGAFENAAGEIVFDLDDFDRATSGSYLIDLWRMATSIRIAASDRGLPEPAIDRAVHRFATGYLEQLNVFAGNDGEASFRLTAENAGSTVATFLEEARREEGRGRMLDEWSLVRRRDGEKRRRFRSDHDELGAVTADERRRLTDAVDRYAKGLDSPLRRDEGYFEVLDVARRLDAGLGSLGVDRFYVLVRGPSKHRRDDVLLDVKDQSVRLVPFARHSSQLGELVTSAERLLVAEPDVHLGHVEIDGKSFSVRQRNPFKKPFKIRRLRDPETLLDVTGDWARLLAAAHARGDGNSFPHRDFEAAIFEVIGSFEHLFIAEVEAFAKRYAEQTAIDQRLFRELIDE